MFDFIKSLFRKKSADTNAPAGPVLVHADINEIIVIKEVALADVKPKARKLKVATLKEVEPIAIAKGVKTKATKSKPVKSEPAKIVQLVQPIPVKKKGRPKKDKA